MDMVDLHLGDLERIRKLLDQALRDYEALLQQGGLPSQAALREVLHLRARLEGIIHQMTYSIKMLEQLGEGSQATLTPFSVEHPPQVYVRPVEPTDHSSFSAGSYIRHLLGEGDESSLTDGLHSGGIGRNWP